MCIYSQGLNVWKHNIMDLNMQFEPIVHPYVKQSQASDGIDQRGKK